MGGCWADSPASFTNHPGVFSGQSILLVRRCHRFGAAKPEHRPDDRAGGDPWCSSGPRAWPYRSRVRLFRRHASALGSNRGLVEARNGCHDCPLLGLGQATADVRRDFGRNRLCLQSGLPKRACAGAAAITWIESFLCRIRLAVARYIWTEKSLYGPDAPTSPETSTLAG